MIEANRGASEDSLRRAKEESYERFKLQMLEAIERQLEHFEMTWDDLAARLCWSSPPMTGQEVKKKVGDNGTTDEMLNDIAHVFSAEIYMIFRPRWPWVGT